MCSVQTDRMMVGVHCREVRGDRHHLTVTVTGKEKV